MKVSKEIKEKMHKIANLQSQCLELSREISDYFERKGFDTELLRNGKGVSLEELDYGNDVTDEFCRAIEEGDWDFARKFEGE